MVECSVQLDPRVTSYLQLHLSASSVQYASNPVVVQAKSCFEPYRATQGRSSASMQTPKSDPTEMADV